MSRLIYNLKKVRHEIKAKKKVDDVWISLFGEIMDILLVTLLAALCFLVHVKGIVSSKLINLRHCYYIHGFGKETDILIVIGPVHNSICSYASCRCS